MTKVQLTLTDQEADLITQQAQVLGYSLARYLKFIVSQEAIASSKNIPSFPMSLKTEKTLLKALKDYKENKVFSLKDSQELALL